MPHIYVLFTSGSTGSPVGVLGTETGLLNRVKWAQSQGFLNPSDTYAFKTAPVFVDSLMECLGSLLGGARILAIPRALLKDPAKCIEALRLGEASIVAALPRVWRSWAAAAAPGGPLPPARVGVSSGEPLTGPALRAMRALLPAPARLLNLYGCTETAADATWADLSGWSGHSAAPIPVGRPLPGVVVAVCREESVHFAGAPQTSTMGGTQKDPVVTHDQGASALCELGSPGRVLVAGLCLAEGTTGDGCLALRWFEGLTRAREGPVSLAGHSDDMPDRMPFFDTGDWGCMDDARCLTLLGRTDRCVKVSGTRVDLAEVEMVLGEIEGVKEAVAWLASSLLALVFCNEPSAMHGEALRSQAAARLHAAAVPAVVLLLPAAQVPYTTSGKLDRMAAQALARPLVSRRLTARGLGKRPRLPLTGWPAAVAGRGSGDAGALPPPASWTEADVAAAVAAVLGRAPEACEDMILGGADSLAIAALAASLRIPPAVVVADPTIRGLARHLAPCSGHDAEPASSSLHPALQGARVWGGAPARAGPSLLVEGWRVALTMCVDAPACLLGSRVYACSHGGSVACLAVPAGDVVWRCEGQGPLDAGVCVCGPSLAFLTVAASTGVLSILHADTGGVVGDVDAGGPVRARPVTDIHHRVWIGTHARSMLILTISDGDPVAQFRQESIPLLGPVSAAVTFVPALQLAVAACLDGSVVGISCRARRGQPETVAWTLGSSELGMRRAPLFAPVAVCPGRTGLSVVAVSAVGGCARIDLNASLKDCDGCSPIALPCAPAPSGVYAPLSALGDGGLAMGCEDGRLCILQAYSGAGWQEQPLQISLPGLGSRITGLVHVTAPGTSLAQPLLVATTASGHVALLAPSEGAVPAWQIREAICLPAPIFSAPTFDVETGSLFLGCRDDHVYCLRIGH
ncbi:hypothetical protein ACKKBF_B10465 [Auxenochlorella protothecoides x Auxenochlorella symbiontica]